MAQIVFAGGTSHTPLLTFESSLWREYAARDFKATRLNTMSGDFVTYDELLERVEERHDEKATDGEFNRKHDLCHHALDRLSEELLASEPDVVIIVTDDESELFSRQNTPAISIYYGDTVITRPFSTVMQLPDPPAFLNEMVKRYAMDQAHTFLGSGEFGRSLIENLIDRHIDVGAAAQISEPERSGFGHGIGFVLDRLFQGKTIPVLPVMLNTYFPPNVPKPLRCWEIGHALRAAIDESEQDLRVAIIASGGLSHFIVEEELDRSVLKALDNGDEEALTSISPKALNSGSSEIRNWILVGGVMKGSALDWHEYCPLYRTAAGTGVGAAFASWDITT